MSVDTKDDQELQELRLQLTTALDTTTRLLTQASTRRDISAGDYETGRVRALAGVRGKRTYIPNEAFSPVQRRSPEGDIQGVKETLDVLDDLLRNPSRYGVEFIEDREE